MHRPITYDPQRDYYIALGIDAHASPDLIRRAYRQAVRAAHPDRHPDRVAWATEQLMLLNEAYDVLSTPDLRRRYDHARWLHVPHVPRAAPPFAERNPFDLFTTQPSRPWWDQASRRSPRAYKPTVTPEPAWLLVADWLKAHHLGLLEPVWVTLVGLWRSPYGGLITLLTVILMIHVAFLAYAWGQPDPWGSLRDLLSHPVPTAAPTAVPAPTATPDHLVTLCADPDVQITSPAAREVVSESFMVSGIVQPLDLWHYGLLAGYLGPEFTPDSLPERWITLRPPPITPGGSDEVVPGGSLTAGPVTLPGSSGYWVLRLVVVLRGGIRLSPCDVVVLRP